MDEGEEILGLLANDIPNLEALAEKEALQNILNEHFQGGNGSVTASDYVEVNDEGIQHRFANIDDGDTDEFIMQHKKQKHYVQN